MLTIVRYFEVWSTNHYQNQHPNQDFDFLGERDNPKDKAPRVQRRHPQKRHRSFPPGSASEFGNFSINL